ncbi:MAG TPA: phosphoribosylamine--glycine ligase [Candidatus Acidoferrales bacterium]|nr:phosphoribosylamine--glycine ligase [Candidatus Acidoferrales bacterium]
MKILLIGGGGREHAMAWKLRQGAQVEKVWCAPGNGGIAADAECVPLNVADVKAASELAAHLGADLTIAGPELPLVNGIADELSARGLAVLGPGAQGAQLEGSKIFAKQFMERHGIPTAPLYGIFDNPIDAYTALCAVDWPLVIKADGLCAGKGVLVTSSPDEATAFITCLMEQGEFGDAGRRVILEEGLTGEELSYIVLTDGTDFISMAPSRDHKRAYDHDEGPNTGGMGAYSSDDLLSSSLERQIIQNIVRPTIAGLAKDGISYRGFLYFGLMLTPDGAKVLEYNCRLGDPETEAILPRADFNLAEALGAAARGSLEGINPKWFPGASACIVIASEGYPGHPATGRVIHGLPPREDGAADARAIVFHAGTRRDGESYYTTAGRSLVVSARGDDLGAALRAAYEMVGRIQIEGAFYRTDIGTSGSKKGRAAADQPAT